MVTYTTAAKVRLRVTGYSASPTDAAIEGYIDDAEGFINGLTLYDWREKWDGNKLGLIAKLATDMAAYLVVASDPSVSTTNSEAALMMDGFWADSQRTIRLLRDSRILKWLKSEIGVEE